MRAQRLRADMVTVDDLLDLYVLDCADHRRPVQQGRVEPWRTALGSVLACEVRRPDLDALCRRWQRRGLTWDAGTRMLTDGTTVTWTARDSERVRPISGANCNRLIAVLRRAYALGKEKLDLTTPLTFPRYAERRRGEYLTEDQCRAICAQFQAKIGADVKADVFRFAYLTGIRKGQLIRTRKRHVLIAGETWKLRWPGEETKNGEPHELMLVGEELEIVQRAWAKRLPDCDLLFHANGKRLGPMISELQTPAHLRAARHPIRTPQGRRLPRHPAQRGHQPRCFRHGRSGGDVDHRPQRSDDLQTLQPPPRFRAGGSSGTPQRLSRCPARHDANRAGDWPHEVTTVPSRRVRHRIPGTSFRAHHWHTRPGLALLRHQAPRVSY
jgi:integrase